MSQNNSPKLPDEDLAKDVGISDADKQDKTEQNPGQTVPPTVNYDPAEEQDLDELVHQQNINAGGNLPDPESIPRNEDDEFEEGRLTKK
jgi:hypothetical protein